MSAPRDDVGRDMEPREVIRRAAELLAARYGVSETVAFRRLVQASVDSEVSVREAARRIVAASE